MALILKDRVKETSSSSGTGNIALGGAFPGYQTFNAAIASGSTVYYTIHNLTAGDDDEWEVGLGTFTSPATLARTTVLSSSNSGSAVNFTAGASGLEVFITQPAEEAVYLNQATGLVEIGGNGTNTVSFTNVNTTNLTANTTTATTSNATTFNGTTGAFTNVSGNGVALTAINASNVTSGTLDNARTTGNTANSASTIVLRDANGSFGANVVTATFSGNGATLSAINASNISSGTIDNARTTAASANGASTIVQRDSGGNFAAGAITGTSFSGNGASITAINATAITTGTIDNARTTAASANGANTIVVRDASGDFATDGVTANWFTGNGANLSAINASNIASGTVATARLGTGTANASTFLRGDQTYAVVSSGTLIPAGTVMLFAQTTAPTGFTKNTSTGDNSALRVTTGTASTGGSVGFTTAFASQTPSGSVSITAVSGSAGATTLTTPQIPSHSHPNGGSNSGLAHFPAEGGAADVGTTGNTGGGGSHTHPFSFSSGSGTFTGNAINLAVQYIDVIRATKD